MRRLVLEQPLSRAAIWSLRLAAFALVVTLYGAALVRGGQQGAPGLAALGSGFALAALTLLLAAIAFTAIWRRGLKGAGRAVAASLIAALLLAGPVYVALQIIRLPLLNDISTDIEDPPAFARSRAALAARDGRVPPEIPREARQAQRQAYQRIIPILTDLPAEEAFPLALKAATDMGWRVIERMPPGGRSGVGRIEAVAVTPILRFSDDITIRVRPRVDGSRIDIRSASRLGRHDLGANAARIQAFNDQLQALLSAR